MIRKFSLAVALMTFACVASAGSSGGSNCINFWIFTWCAPVKNPSPVNAPEIDPASAMAGLTMLAGGLAVLRGRRRVISKE
jgi:hypothetical protein